MLKERHRILLVDDEAQILRALQRLLRREGGLETLTAGNGAEGLELLRKRGAEISLIISDQRMPGMEGAQFLEWAKALAPQAQRFLLTGHSDFGAIVAAVNQGEIHRYITKPWNDMELLLLVRQGLQHVELVEENRRLLALTREQNEALAAANTQLESRVAQRTAELCRKSEELERSFRATAQLLATLVEHLDPPLGRQMRRVAELSARVAGALGLDGPDRDMLELAAMIHDIGLLGLPAACWNGSGKEWGAAEEKAFANHPLIAAICLENIERLSGAAEIVLHHHEDADGGGFPNGLQGEAIPLGARILRAAAAWCQIVATWPAEPSKLLPLARKTLGAEARELVIAEGVDLRPRLAEQVLLAGGGRQFDMRVVTALLQVAQEADRTSQGAPVWVTPADIRPGMQLAMDLRLTDGRMLLARGGRLRASLIPSIRSLVERGLLEPRILLIPAS